MDETFDVVLSLRATRTGPQLQLLDRIWKGYVATRKPLARRVLHAEAGGSSDIERVVAELGGSIVQRTSQSGDDLAGYRLTFLGALLTSEGQIIEDVLAAVLSDVRERLRQDPNFVTWDRDGFDALCRREPNAERLLPRLFGMHEGFFSWSGNADPQSFRLEVPDDVVDAVLEAQDMKLLVRQVAGSRYRSDAQLDPDAEWRSGSTRVERVTPLFGVASVVSEPLDAASEASERILREAEAVLRREGPQSAVDRIHTGLQSVLLDVLHAEEIPVPERAELTKLIDLLRTEHPAFAELDVRPNESRTILRALAAITHQLSALRNNASIAHPAQELLTDAEAMLAINAARTVMHYIDMRLREHGTIRS